jgi:hypothetical protein
MQQFSMAATVRSVGFVAFKNGFFNVKNRLQWHFKWREACNNISLLCCWPFEGPQFCEVYKRAESYIRVVYSSGHLKTKINPHYTYSHRTSQRTQCASIRKTNWLLLYRKSNAAYIDTYMKWFCGLDSYGSGQPWLVGRCPCGHKPSGFIKCREFLGYLKKH